jgi:hypothetical protein
LTEEGSDPDGDGLSGVLDEIFLAGTDPFLADTDGDGSDDDAETGAGTNPLNPADHPSATALTVGSRLPMDLDDGGLATDGLAWEWGAPSGGPGAGYTDSTAWATNLVGTYPYSVEEKVYLPPIDVTAATEPVLGFRMWMDGNHGDGVSIERYDTGVGWVHILASAPLYDSTDAGGYTAWRNPADPTSF